MKPYGVPRSAIEEFPDVDDIQKAGRATHVGRIKKAGRDQHGYLRTKTKKVIRRYWKKKARREAKEASHA